MLKNRALLLAAVSAVAMTGIVGEALAGGFAIREQSTYGQGSSFAGIAAGGALSSMFWNPATITQFDGMNSESGVSLIIPDAKHTSGGATVVNNSGDMALVPGSYYSYQFNERFWAGLGINAPFGLGVSFPKIWAAGAGSAYAQDSAAQSINLNPNIAYKVNDWLSVAVGLQAQYLGVKYENFLGAVPPNLMLKGNGWGFGVTAGVTVKPTSTTTVGLGYRSAINQNISGKVYNNIAGGSNGPIETTLRLPDTVTLGLRQDINEKFRMLAGVEWSNWSRIGTARINLKSGGPALAPGGVSQITLPFQYDDGWLFSLGGEYDVNQQISLRAGVAYEISPVTDAVRTPRLPDNDRMWYSIGATVKDIFPNLSADLGYSFIDVSSTPVNVVAGNPWFTGTPYNGSVDSNIHIFSASLRYQW